MDRAAVKRLEKDMDGSQRLREENNQYI